MLVWSIILFSVVGLANPAPVPNVPFFGFPFPGGNVESSSSSSHTSSSSSSASSQSSSSSSRFSSGLLPVVLQPAIAVGQGLTNIFSVGQGGANSQSNIAKFYGNENLNANSQGRFGNVESSAGQIGLTNANTNFNTGFSEANTNLNVNAQSIGQSSSLLQNQQNLNAQQFSNAGIQQGVSVIQGSGALANAGQNQNQGLNQNNGADNLGGKISYYAQSGPVVHIVRADNDLGITGSGNNQGSGSVNAAGAVANAGQVGSQFFQGSQNSGSYANAANQQFEHAEADKLDFVGTNTGYSNLDTAVIGEQTQFDGASSLDVANIGQAGGHQSSSSFFETSSSGSFGGSESKSSSSSNFNNNLYNRDFPF
nr:uncharacterized protein DDB_G0271670-like [Neodiprion pinetum]